MNVGDEPYVAVDKADVARYDDTTLGRWIRLKALADDTWPEPAPIPRWCKPATLAALADRVAVQGDYYRIPSLDRRREFQRARARRAAEERWGTGANSSASSSAEGSATRGAHHTTPQSHHNSSNDENGNKWRGRAAPERAARARTRTVSQPQSLRDLLGPLAPQFKAQIDA